MGMPQNNLVEGQGTGILPDPRNESGTCIRDLNFEALVEGRIPPERLIQGSKSLSAVAKHLLERFASGMRDYFLTDSGGEKPRFFADSRLPEVIGQSDRKSGYENIFF